MKLNLMLLLFVGSFCLFGQANQLIHLKHVDPTSEFSDLKQLDSYFENVRVVGMGESTHGTHEFFTMRHRIFRYLVESHGFNTFFLEGNYVVCKPIDDYIKGGGGDPKRLIDGIQLWPWITEEMLDLVEWMRTYNQQNPDNQLSFVGVDMQKYRESLDEMYMLAEEYHVSVPSNPRFDTLTTAEFFLLKKKSLYKELQAWATQFTQLDFSKFFNDETHVRILTRHLSQIAEERLSKDSYRDQMMAENLLYFMNQSPSIKGFFWAHNGHLANWYNEKKGNWVAGGVINNTLKDKYLSIGQDFYQGSFNVRYYDKAKTNETGEMTFTLGEVEVGPAPEGSLAERFINSGTPLFIPFSLFDQGDAVYMSMIGAIYHISDNPKSIYRYNAHGTGAFDAVILIENSTPTRLLEGY